LPVWHVAVVAYPLLHVCTAHAMQTRSAVSVGADAWYQSASHADTAAHVRSLLAPGATDSNSLSAHVLRSSHVRSLCVVGATDWYLLGAVGSALHTVRREQARFVVAAGWTDSYSVSVHSVSVRQVRSLDAVSCALSYWLVVHGVRSAHVASGPLGEDAVNSYNPRAFGH